MYMLEMKNVSKSFGGVKALTDVSIAIKPGEVRALIGENGAGKSTLMKILAGAIQKDSGTICIEGKEAVCSTPREALDRGISVIYQELNMVPDLTVADNIFLNSLLSKGGIVKKKEMNEQTEKLMQSLGVDINPNTLVGSLTVARQQMIEIAKAIKNNSKIVVFDEPSAVLGVKDAEILFEHIKRLKEQGISIIYISHRLDEVMRITDTVTVLRDGKHIITDETKNLTMEKLVEHMTGQPYGNLKNSTEYIPNTKDIVFEVEGLTARDGRFQDVSFHIREGEVLGLAGLVGSGRSEIARAIFGADPKASGTVKIHGKPVRIRTPKDAKKHGLGFVMEDRKVSGLLIEESIANNITITDLPRYATCGLIHRRKEYAGVNDYKEKLSIKTDDITNPVSSLSGGNQQKVSIAKWLHALPEVLILDEPTRGVDVGAKSEIYGLIEMIRSQGKAILLISSEFAEILSLSDRVVVVKRGRIVGEYTREQIAKDSAILDAL